MKNSFLHQSATGNVDPPFQLIRENNNKYATFNQMTTITKQNIKFEFDTVN
jgi:hypothetical protein